MHATPLLQGGQGLTTGAQFGLFLCLFAFLALLTGGLALPRWIREARARRAQLAPSAGQRAPAASYRARPAAAPLAPRPAAVPVAPKPQPAAKAQAEDPATRTRAAVAALPRTTWPREPSRTALPLAFDGRDWVRFPLDGGEHLIICGSSGSGKGNLLQYLILQALQLGPERVQVWVVDAKNGLDYAFCTALAHARLYADVPDADGTITAGLDAAAAEMEARNRQMFGQARKVQEWNAKRPDEALPYILLIVDEVAELSGPQHATLCTLARMARSAGIVVVPVTQYPTADVLPSQIQSNCLNRVCLKVESTKRSDVSLGLERGDERTYEPAAIAEPGVAVVRRAGNRWALGRVPEVTEQLHAELVDDLVTAYPRREGDVPAPPPVNAPPVKRTTCTAEEVADYLTAHPGASQTQVERELFGYTGGAAYKAVSRVWGEALLLRALPENDTTTAS